MKTPETSKLFTQKFDSVSGESYYVLNERVAPYQKGFYFINNSMTADGRYLWFVVQYPPLDQSFSHLAYIDFETDEAVVCEDTVDGATYIDPADGAAYFIYKADLFRRRPGKDQVTERLHRIPTRGVARSCATHLTLTPDGKKFFLDIRSGIDNNDCGTLDLETGEFELWASAPFWTDHGQMNPVRDDIALCAYDSGTDIETGKVMRCPQDENGVYQRLWTVTRDGVRTCYPPLNNYATHEWWNAKGDIFYYCCDNYGIYGIELATGKDVTILEGWDPWHSHSTADDNLFVFDEKKLERYGGKWYRGCPAAVNLLNRKTGKVAVIVSEMPDNGHTPENPNNYHIDPHPRFNSNERYIVFTTSELGGCDLAIAVVDEVLPFTE